jgi:outer membrane protein OmpA-like peptidoglycan-associated protein
MTVKNFFLAIVSICFFNTILGQTAALKKANKFYGLQAYADAIPLYEKVYKKDSSNKLVLSNLGDCYRLTNNANGQIKCYGNLIKYGKAEPIHKLYYGEALMSNGKSDDAKKYFYEYTADSRGKNLSKYSEKYKSYFKNADAYKVDLAPFNSNQNDFCAVKFYNTVVFASSRNKTAWINTKHGWTNDSYLNLYTTEKDEKGKDLKPKVFMRDLDSKYNDGPVSFTKDYISVFFTRNNSNAKEISKDGTYKLKVLTASLNKNGFDKVTVLPFNNNNYNCAHPCISADGNTLYFASDMEGGQGGMDIYMVKKDATGAWGKPVNLGDNVNTAGSEVFPFIATNGLLYFSSNGHDGLGGLDIYETKIKDDKAGRVYNMGDPVNSKNDDFGVFLNEDNKTGYISSNRKSGGMDDDIYSFQILREVKRGKEITIITKDKVSGEILPNTKIKVNNEELTTNEKAELQTVIEEDLNYNLVVEKDDYFKLEDSVSTKSDPSDTFTKTLTLEKDPKLALVALVTDIKTNAPIEGVKMTLKELPSNTIFDTILTPTTGDYRKALKNKKIGDKISYQITLTKQGYLEKSATFIYDIKKPGDININESMDLKIGKALVGTDLGKLIEIKPIYFDLGKSIVRKDAAIELDKVVKVMKEYPGMYIELGSHTDCRGAAAQNTKLSGARAKASAAYIIKNGIAKDRIVGKGYGESKLLNGCMCEGKIKPTCSEDEHAKNRRTEFIITKMK